VAGSTLSLTSSSPVNEGVDTAGESKVPAKTSGRESAEASSVVINEPTSIPPIVGNNTLGGTKVLIVDNEPLFRESVRDSFSDTDIAFIEAGSVEEACGKLDADKQIRIILLDLELSGENGTKVLDHINERASEYRVIILTGHDELLPAREAAIYKVFYYLSKSEGGLTRHSLCFAIEQARQDIERAALANKNNADKFDDVVLNEYPTFFTYIYRELKSDLSMLEKLARQRDIFKLLIHFSAVALVCEYFDSDIKDNELDSKIQLSTVEPTLSSWFKIINEILERQGKLSSGFFLEYFSTFFTNKNEKDMLALIQMLDAYLSQGIKLSEFEYEEVTRRCEGLLVPLLQDYQFITKFLLCYVWSVQKVRSAYRYRIKECTGANPQLLFSKREFNFLMNSDELHIINLDSQQSLSLHPFIILEFCEECKQSEIFFYMKFDNNRLQYVSYKTGHTNYKEADPEDLKKFTKTTA
jgi:DNA-binding NarL/FixJ family response regulator